MKNKRTRYTALIANISPVPLEDGINLIYKKVHAYSEAALDKIIATHKRYAYVATVMYRGVCKDKEMELLTEGSWHLQPIVELYFDFVGEDLVPKPQYKV